jgi:biofilm PGA synthesis N-glycosyltransferase PgaC
MTAIGDDYVIVTPAYNEAADIVYTIESVVRQTIRPLRWLIVDDGSTDDTSAVVHSYMRKWDFIQYIRRTRAADQTYYASNVYAIMDGVRYLKDVDYGFLAVLDADIVLPNDYYEKILTKFHVDPRLGVASGVDDILVGGRLCKELSDRRSTPKNNQVFRRECFESIGGYVPLKYGGEDTCTCIMARMKGWVSWSFPDIRVVHRRPVGVRNARSLLRARFMQGVCEYSLSTHPLFMVGKSVRRCIQENPFLVGGALRMAGYIYGHLKREPRQIPVEVAAFARREQVDRLLHLNRVPQRDRVRIAEVRSAGASPLAKASTSA